ncbi:M14 family zinc carboxypeptidase [Chromatiaceae bacterium AAb-1]|nr:M14 family zinc carboxypeptidase [Chromatiaceae bacterium AAb-1]
MKLGVFLLTFWLATAQAQYFQEPVNQLLPAPEQILGFKVGDWHVRHDQIQRYFEVLAEQSDRVHLEVIGYTHEQRPLLQLIISSEQNIRRLDQIREQHQRQARQGADIAENTPVIIWLGYSVHGNEASAANAAIVLAHYLTAVQTAEVNSWLEHAVILLQPVLNPDGHDRFAIWANMHKGQTAVTDPVHREHIEPWPNGRPNHYWADLNRDWLLLQHPESRARIAQLQQWLPNVVGDYHEMGTDSTFFFQPGIPSRNYPLTPARNYELTRLLASYHAGAFDTAQQLYYTEESFDDFYVGKGSTYPDVNGGVGILFEQASSRGHAQESVNGVLRFQDAIQNQFTASLSLIRGAVAQRESLLTYQQEFFNSALQQARNDKVKGYILTEPDDKTRLEALLDLLQRHHIDVYPLVRDWQDDNERFTAGSSYYIPLQQPQYRLIKAAFSTEKNFRDNTFYDVSSWTLPYAYNIRFKAVNREPGKVVSEQRWLSRPVITKPLPADAYAYVFSWHDQQAPLLLNTLLHEGIAVRAAMADFTAATTEGEQRFKAGAMVVVAGQQQRPDWFARLQRLQQQSGLTLSAVRTGLTVEGSDLGSNRFVPVKSPQVLLMAGPGISSVEAGEVWYNLERLAGISPTLAEPERLSRLDLNRYTHIILPDGNYSQWQEADIQQLKRWLENGGVLWGHKRGAAWLARNKLVYAGVWQEQEMSSLIPRQNLTYADKEQLAGKQRIAGAIFSAELDLSHPLAFGFTRTTLPLFKNSTFLLQPASAPFTNVALYSNKPHLAGYTAAEYVSRIGQGAALIAHNAGKGRVIAMTDNPVFRGYFLGSSRLLINALYFGSSFSTPVQAE